MLVNIALLVRLGIGDDAAGHGSGYLAYQDILASGSGNHHVGMLIFLAGFGEPGLVVVAILVMNELYLAVDGEPVGMHVERTHEDGDHQALVVEILILLSLFHHYNLTVGRSHDQFLRIAVEVADGTTVEIEGHEPGGTEDGYEDPKRDMRVEEIQEQRGYRQQQTC